MRSIIFEGLMVRVFREKRLIMYNNLSLLIVEKEIKDLESINTASNSKDALLETKSVSSSHIEKSDGLGLQAESNSQRSVFDIQHKRSVLADSIVSNYVDEFIHLQDSDTTGYFTLSALGAIQDVDFIGSRILARDREDLINQPFEAFVSLDSKETFRSFLQKVFELHSKQECQINVFEDRTLYSCVRLRAIASLSGDECLVLVSDCSDQKKLVDFQATLLAALPYPALYISRKDRTIIAANQQAIDIGATIGGYCWRDIMHCKHLSSENRDLASQQHTVVNEEGTIKCNYCRADECFGSSQLLCNYELNLDKKIWDVYWIKVSDDVFLHYFNDVTERKMTEKSLRDSEIYLKLTQKIAKLGSFSLDIIEGKWTSSDVLDEILGIDANFVKTIDSLKGLIHSDWKNVITDYIILNIMGIKTKLAREFQVIRQNDQSVRWVHAMADVEYNKAGRIIRVIGTIRDITKHKQAQEIIRESEEKYRTVADNTNDWEFWIDQDNRFIYCSPSCEKITGYKAEDFLQNPQLLYEIVLPEDQHIVRYLKDMSKTQYPLNDETQFRIVKADGKISWMSYVYRFVYDYAGVCLGIRGSNRDITKIKETEHLLRINERKYKLLAENITDGVFVCINGVFEYINSGMNHILGYRDSELEGLKLSSLVHGDPPGGFMNFVNSCSSDNQTLNVEFECAKKDKSIILVEMYLNYVAEEGSVYGVMQDVTEKREIQQRNILKAIVQTEEKEKAVFSKELHDGLGPLLSTIKLYLQWTKRIEDIKKRDEVIDKSEEILDEAIISVKEISNRLSPHLLVNYGLKSAIQNFTNKLESTGSINIDFQSNLDRRFDIVIETALYRAVIECINNTIKYAEADNIYIVLNQIANTIQLQYIDDGIGFDLQKTLSSKNGLGLFDLQSRIQTIGGQLKLFSMPGQGVDYRIVVNLE